MKRTPEIGDIVRIGKGKKDQLVIRAEDDTDFDTLRGDSYPRFVFVTIPYVVGASVDPKEKKYLISHCCGAEKGETKVDLVDIEFVHTTKFKEKISRTFTIKEW